MKPRTVVSGIAAGAFALVVVLPAFSQQSPRVKVDEPPPAVMATADDEFDPAVARRMSIEEFKKRYDAKEKILIIDTRHNPSGPIAKGADIVTLENLKTWSADKAKNALIVAYCT
jgi:hypothetical protein